MPIKYQGSVYVEAQAPTLETAIEHLVNAEKTLKIALHSGNNREALFAALGTVDALLWQGTQTVKRYLKQQAAEKAAQDAAAAEAPRRY